VIDQNVDAAESLAELIRSEGIQVWTAYSGVAGLDAALRHRPRIVFLDVGLPGLDGYEVARAIRRDDNLVGTYIVAVTAQQDFAHKARAHAAGIDVQLTKPVQSRANLAILLKAFAISPRGQYAPGNE
jgi:CheY-like chemotaxis protein